LKLIYNTTIIMIMMMMR